MQKINQDLLNLISDKLISSERKRGSYNLHSDYSAKLQRLLNVANPDTYVRPHKHDNPEKIEVFVILKGKIAVIEFDDLGGIKDHCILDQKLGNFAVELPPKTYHMFISLEEKSCLLECKPGPYIQKNDKTFAPWAPEELTFQGREFVKEIIKKIGL